MKNHFYSDRANIKRFKCIIFYFIITRSKKTTKKQNWVRIS